MVCTSSTVATIPRPNNPKIDVSSVTAGPVRIIDHHHITQNQRLGTEKRREESAHRLVFQRAGFTSNQHIKKSQQRPFTY